MSSQNLWHDLKCHLLTASIGEQLASTASEGDQKSRRNDLWVCVWEMVILLTFCLPTLSITAPSQFVVMMNWWSVKFNIGTVQSVTWTNAQFGPHGRKIWPVLFPGWILCKVISLEFSFAFILCVSVLDLLVHVWFCCFSTKLNVWLGRSGLFLCQVGRLDLTDGIKPTSSPHSFSQFVSLEAVIMNQWSVGFNTSIAVALWWSTDRMYHGWMFQVIIDECGMCKEVESLVPIVSCRPQQVVLIGDHRQLQPIIIDKTAQSFGLDRSLFERYATSAHMLTIQYRMVCNMACNDLLVVSDKKSI